MSTETYLISLEESRRFFPGKIGKPAILRRIKTGVCGVKLRATFDGFRYWTCEAWIKDFLNEVTAKKLERKKIRIHPTELEYVFHDIKSKYGSFYDRED